MYAWQSIWTTASVRELLQKLLLFACLFSCTWSSSAGLMRLGAEMNINMYISMVYELLRPLPFNLVLNMLGNGPTSSYRNAGEI